MAIGGWFIPFANLYIPYAALSDAWKRTTGQGNPLILIFWLAYVGTIFFTVFYSVWQTNPNILVIERDTMWIAELIGWVDTLVAITAFGLWALIVKQLTDKVG